MKKTYTIVMMVAAIAALIPTLVIAEEALNNETVENEEYIEYTDLSPFEELEEELLETAENETNSTYDDDIASDDEKIREEKSKDPSDADASDKCPNKYLKVRGKWGCGKDQEADGYWGGRITLRKVKDGIRLGVFKGLYNKTGEEETHRIVGIMKKGYFNGKIINEDGTETKITGLYKFNKDERMLKMQWIVPHHAGWAIARVQLVEV